jgi:Putative peptidoglycan binding domain
MKKILVVGLAMVMAAAGNAFAGGNGSGQNGNSSATTGSTSSTSNSSSSSGGQQSGGRSGTPIHSSGNRGAVARSYALNVPNGVQPNGRVLPSLDRAEVLARLAAYYNRNRVNPVQSADQSTANAGQISPVAGQVDLPSQGMIRPRPHRDDENNFRNKINGTNRIDASNGTQATNGLNNARPMPVTNTPPHSKRPVLNFNNANTMSFADACRRHRNAHDCNWWRNHCHTIILIGGGFYAWDLGYWYPAWGYDNYYSNYAYDGPIYGYDGLPPDQIIANVQYALQQLGYFSEAVDGVLGPVTQAAIEDYQVENNLPVTGAIDRPLLVSLGFIR